MIVSTYIQKLLVRYFNYLEIDLPTDIIVRFTLPVFNATETYGYVMVCAEIISGALEKDVSAYLMAIDGSAIIGM